MGTTFGWRTKASLIECLRGTGIGIIATATVGNHYYQLIEHHGGKAILLHLLSQSQGEWGYKTISEDMYPYYFDCPESMLKESTCTEGKAEEWRAACRAAKVEQAAARAFAETLKEGDTFEWQGKKVTYLYKYRGKKVAGRDQVTGRVYAYPMKELKSVQA